MKPATVAGSRRLAVALALALAAGAARADAVTDGYVPPSAEVLAPAASRPVEVRVTHGPAGYEVEGRCRVAVSSDVVWDVLTDYDGIDRFVSSMRESRVSGNHQEGVLVEQVAVGRLLFFSRRMRATLRVREEHPGRIHFEDVLHQDFVSYRGEWIVEKVGAEVEIVYRVDARPAFAVPPGIGGGLFKRTVRELRAEVRGESERRAALAVR